MTLWEKIIINVEKGAQKIVSFASVFSERVKAELALARLRIRVSEVRSSIDEQHRIIGRKVVQLTKKDALAKTTEEFLQDEDIVAAFAEITAREKDLEDLSNEIVNEQEAFKPGAMDQEDKRT